METLLSLHPDLFVMVIAFIISAAWGIPKEPGKQAALRKIITGLMPDLHTVVEGIREYREASETVEVKDLPKASKQFIGPKEEDDADEG